jgi:hypothetical protein
MPQSPGSLPPGAWGGDADPMTSAARARFEQDLQRQSEARAAALAGQPPVIGQPIVGPGPAPKPPLAGGLFIPPDLGRSGDLISGMAEEELRQSNDARRAAGLPVEQNAPQPLQEPAESPGRGKGTPQPFEGPPGSDLLASAGPAGAPRDLANLLAEVAEVLQRGTLPMVRHLTALIAAGRVSKGQLPDILQAASELVTTVVKGMSA